MFKQQRIQLPTDDENTTTSSSRSRPTSFSRSSSSRWSIPCCSTLFISGQRIQLPDDSAEEEEDSESEEQSNNFVIPPPHHQAVTPFNIDFTTATTTSGGNNAFLQHTSKLSRNPFARAPEDDHQKSSGSSSTIKGDNEEVVVEEPTIKHTFEPMEQEGTEELADFSQSTTHAKFDKYANEPDWTEMYQDEEEDSKVEAATTKADVNNTVVQENEITSFAAKTEEGSTSSNTPEEDQEQDVEELSIIDTQITTDDEKEKEEEKIPQIEEEVLKLLPLPQLSNEIPPTLIHKKPSFEKSMYGEEPLMSVSLRPTSQSGPSSTRFSRFSMTEEDFLALKKQEEEEAKKKKEEETVKPFQVESAKTVEVKKDEVVEQDPLFATMSPTENNSKEITIPVATTATQVTQQQQLPEESERRSSIVTTAAHSILGDKLDDFTEKLAFIKKNIIMSIDSDDEDDDEEDVDNAEATLKKIVLMKQQQEQEKKQAASSPMTIKNIGEGQEAPKRPINQHRRTSSLMDVAPTLARFMNTISGANEEKTAAAPTATTSTASNSSSTSFSPSSLFSALAGPMPEPPSVSRNITQQQQQGEKREEEEEEEEEEELFDFTKVIEIGKNMKTFSEGFVGNGIRMFNDVATRMKTSVELQQEEERKRKQHQKEIGEEEEDEIDEASNWLNDSYI